jgi:site-specific DNA-cytosine methylase
VFQQCCARVSFHLPYVVVISLLLILEFRITKKCVLIENTFNARWIRTAVAGMKELGGYAIRVFVINSRTFRAPESRSRAYLLAADVTQVTLAWRPHSGPAG